nr:pilus assembly protein TadG-related protein [uncultured Thermomonospora sp.]
MPVLTRPSPDRPRFRRDRGDGGAIVVGFALLMSSLVVVGMLALVVDVGQLYVEREELQNGADAAALAAARSCAQDEICDPLAFEEVAQSAAEQNASDGAALAILRCTRIDGMTSGPCPLNDPRLTKCVGSRPDTGNFVEIRTRTLSRDGRTLFPSYFGAAVLGKSFEGNQANACARAAWGPLASHPRVFGFGIAECAFEELTSDPAGPGLVPIEQIKAGTPNPAQEAEIRQRQCANPEDPPSEDGPGALAWLGSSAGDCFQQLRAGADQPGSEIASDWSAATCRHDGANKTLGEFLDDNREPLVLPVYDSVTPGDQGTHTYHISGFAYFLPTGYRFGPENAHPSWSTGNDCGGADATPPDPCLTGFFTKGTVVGAVGAGDGYGLQAIQLIG